MHHNHPANKNSHIPDLFVLIHLEECDFNSSTSFIRAIFLDSGGMVIMSWMVDSNWLFREVWSEHFGLIILMGFFARGCTASLAYYAPSGLNPVSPEGAQYAKIGRSPILCQTTQSSPEGAQYKKVGISLIPNISFIILDLIIV
jgi:hypothetical protein